MPLLTILLPTYNRSSYMRKCLESLLATTVDCEVVIGDNASPDDTEAVVQPYLADPRVRYHRHAENIGSIANHNFLLGQVTGKYFCLFGDDDMAMPDCFEQKVAILESHPHVDLVFSLTQVIGPDDEPLKPHKVMGRILNSYIGGRDEFAELFTNCYIGWQTVVCRTQVLREVGDLADGWGLKASIDWYWLQKMVRGRQTAFLNYPTIRLRHHPGSFSSTTVIKEGYWAHDRPMIWRKWLLEDPNPPVISELIWDRMVTCTSIDVQDTYGGDPAKLDEALRNLVELQVAYRRRMNELAQEAIRQGDPYQAGTAPWPLEDLRRRSFFFPPVWSEPRWQDVLRSFATTFTDRDDVTLVLALDPSQGVSLDEAGERIMAVLAAAGVESPPDLLLVPEPDTDAELARLYAAVDAVVAAGDRLIAHRARRMGKGVVEELSTDAWRALETKRS